MPSGESGGETRIQVGLELLPVGPVLHPRAGRVQVLADGDVRGVSNQGGRLAPVAQRDAQHAETALGVVIGDALDLAGQILRAPLVAGKGERAARTSVSIPGTHA